MNKRKNNNNNNNKNYILRTTRTNTNEDTDNNEEDTQDSDDVEGPRQATIIDISNTSHSDTDEDSDDNLAKKMPAIEAPINLNLNQEQDTNPYTLVQARKKKGKNTQRRVTVNTPEEMGTPGKMSGQKHEEPRNPHNPKNTYTCGHTSGYQFQT
jgi:hypothetical protein